MPVIKNLGTQKLKTIRLKKKINGINTEFGDAYRKLGPVPTVSRPDPATDRSTEYLQKNQVILNWYPKIQVMKSGGLVGGDADAAPNQTHLGPRHVAFPPRWSCVRRVRRSPAAVENSAPGKP